MRTNPPVTAEGFPERAATFVRGMIALCLFAGLMTVAVLLALLLPSLAWRRASTRHVAGLWLRLAGIRVALHGGERLPAGSCVLVANHSSYLDGILLTAALPPRFTFVIKREAASMPVVGLLLRRIGSEFVDRGSGGGRQRDARRVMQRAVAGHSLVFFPEGTFDAQEGLKRFHAGAFVAAVRAAVPVVPAVITGARRALPSGTFLPRPGAVEIEVLQVIHIRDRDSSERLRIEARAAILARLQEPDLDHGRAATAPA